MCTAEGLLYEYMFGAFCSKEVKSKNSNKKQICLENARKMQKIEKALKASTRKVLYFCTFYSRENSRKIYIQRNAAKKWKTKTMGKSFLFLLRHRIIKVIYFCFRDKYEVLSFAIFFQIQGTASGVENIKYDFVFKVLQQMKKFLKSFVNCEICKCMFFCCKAESLKAKLFLISINILN